VLFNAPNLSSGAVRHWKGAMGWPLADTVASGCMHGGNTRRTGEVTGSLIEGAARCL
jgi:hypothetical protein